MAIFQWSAATGAWLDVTVRLWDEVDWGLFVGVRGSLRTDWCGGGMGRCSRRREGGGLVVIRWRWWWCVFMRVLRWWWWCHVWWLWWCWEKGDDGVFWGCCCDGGGIMYMVMMLTKERRWCVLRVMMWWCWDRWWCDNEDNEGYYDVKSKEKQINFIIILRKV